MIPLSKLMKTKITITLLTRIILMVILNSNLSIIHLFITSGFHLGIKIIIPIDNLHHHLWLNLGNNILDLITMQEQVLD